MPKEAVLIHGWDPSFYNTNVALPENKGMAWEHRGKLINLLSRDFDIRYLNLPGFCGVPEPKREYFEVEDFAGYLEKKIKENAIKPSVIIGYSFGGAIALAYKARYHDPIPIVLVSPAIVRKGSFRSSLASRFKNAFPEEVADNVKSIYQYIFSKYYRQGTPFLRASYDRVVRKDLSSLLGQIDPSEILLIYGHADTATPWKLVEARVKASGIHYVLVKGGDHNIGQTHPEAIVKAINEFFPDKK